MTIMHSFDVIEESHGRDALHCKSLRIHGLLHVLDELLA